MKLSDQNLRPHDYFGHYFSRKVPWKVVNGLEYFVINGYRVWLLFWNWATALMLFYPHLLFIISIILQE